MLLSLFVAGCVTGAGAILGGNKIVKLVKQNRNMGKELEELKKELKSIKDDLSKK